MAAKKKENAAYRTLRQDLKSGNINKLYVFYGEERYLLESCVSRLEHQLLPAGMEEFNLHRFSGKDLDVGELIAAMDSFPMMSEHLLITVTDFDLFGCSEAKKNMLAEAFEDLPDYLCLIFIYDTLPYKIGRGKFQELVKKTGTIVEFTPADRTDLVDWICRQFKLSGKEIADKDAEYLIFLCGSLMTGLQSEIQKIGSYTKGVCVTRSDIDAVADPVLSARVFDITDAVSSRDFTKAMQILADLLSLKESPIGLLAVMGKTMRQLYTARLCMENRKGTQLLMEMWNMKSSWQADKLMQSARRCPLDWCRNALRLVGETDFIMKSTGRDSTEVLTEFLIRLANG